MKPPTFPHFNNSARRELLEKSRLAKLPGLPQSLPGITPPNFAQAPLSSAACAACGGRLERDNEFQQSVKVCRQCLGLYAKIDSALQFRADEKTRIQRLEKFSTEGELR